MTPQLRFSEFTDEWQVKRLGDLLSVGSGRDYKHLKDGNVPVYGTGGLMTHVDDYLYDGASVAIGRKGTIDQPQFLTGKFWTVDTLFYTHNYKDTTPEFVYLLFQRINWQKWNEASGVPSLSSSTIKTIKTAVPPLEEQQKIADFLTAVDDKVSALEQKVEKLTTYKRGVMQKIFARRIRFTRPDGSQYPEWQEKNLGDLLIYARNGLSLDQNTQRKGYKISRIETISDGVVNLEKVGYVNTDTNILEHRLAVGDILFSNINSPSQIGKVVYIDKDYDLYHGMNLLRLKPDIAAVVPKYLFFVLNSKKYKQYFERICNKAVNQASINQTDLRKTLIDIPSVDEQKKIAAFLSSIDQKITFTTQQLEKTKEFKKGLLQRMFV